MKKFIVNIIALLMVAIGAMAQGNKATADTTAISGRPVFKTEVWTSDQGKTKTSVTAIYNGKTYKSNLESLRRDTQIRRYKGTPTYVIVRRGKAERLIVL